MNKFRLKILYFISFCLLGLALIYSFYLFCVPKILSSSKFKTKINSIIYEKTGIEVNSEHFNVKTFPNLMIKVDADKINLDTKNDELIQADNFEVLFDIKKGSFKSINIDYIYINETGFKSIIKGNKKSKISDIKFKELPDVLVKKAEIWIDKGNEDSVFITVDNLHQYNENNKTYFTFDLEIVSNLLKNLINIGKHGRLYIDDNNVYAENLQALIGISELNINGKIFDNSKNFDFKLQGKELPVQDVISSILYFQKIREPGRKFIENFYDYSGTVDVDLNINNLGIDGKATTKNLSANSVLFDVPISFPLVDFIFEQKSMNAEANGILGNEKVYTNVSIQNMSTTEQEVTGYVNSKLTEKFAEKYIPNLAIKHFADTSVTYKIKNKEIDVDYLLKIPQGSDLYYKTIYLGLADKNRRLLINTHKSADKLYITNYDYSTQNGSEISKIIMGKGSLTKENGHFIPDYITCKTQNDAPVSVAGSFYKYVEGGFFNGDIKYDFRKKLLTGIFDIKDSQYKNFNVKQATVNATEEKVYIEATGSYKNSPFECKISGLNKFSKQIKIYDMYLFLDKYIVKKTKTSDKISVPEITNKIQKTVKQIDVDVDKWTIKVNKIIRNRLVISDILVTGSIHNNIFNFNVSNLNFAKGSISANGNYNYKDKSSNVKVNAKHIDSATVADVIFELPGQIEGIADATLVAKTKKGIENINAFVNFSIKDGYLPKLGSTEFMINKSRMIKKPLKFKVSDVVNIDIKNMKALSSDVEGSFYLNDDLIKDAKITSSQKYLSLLIEGDYDTYKQYADFSILGKYNNSKITKIKILFVPLSLIVKVILRPEKTMEKYKLKLKEVPEIEAESDEISAFRVKINGNINNNDVKVEMKSIK
ncbi:hypothetical protein IJ182_03570 [bacterium]|nr:hypothetical protein [bacterium]